ncbi:MAG TPA: DUF559 domain-containing protein [Solirubrobacteraceae bacterium]
MILDDGGPPIRVDFAGREQRVVIEADSEKWRLTRQRFQTDRQRDQRLIAAGWTIIRTTWKQMTRRLHELRRWSSSYCRRRPGLNARPADQPLPTPPADQPLPAPRAPPRGPPRGSPTSAPWQATLPENSQPDPRSIPAPSFSLRDVTSAKGARMSSHKLTKPIAIAAIALILAGAAAGIIGLTGGGSSSAATTSSTTAAHAAGASASGSGSGGSNARSGPAAGGSIGTVSSVSTSGFTLSTSTGEKVTIKETSSTKYEKGTTAASKSAVTKGKNVLVLGTDNNTTITATEIIVGPPKPNSKTASQVVTFNRGNGDTSKTVGQIPGSYKQGTGTILSGTTANKATEAALLTYPGGVVDRVVKLSNGDYEVHNIGVNWPHHIFVNNDFKVIGAND